MKNKHFFQLIPGLFAWCVIGLISSPMVMAEPLETGLAAMKPEKTDRCPVCGMFPHKYPKWIAGFIFQDGSKYFHCSPKCMLHNLHNVAKYQPGEKREHIKRIWITEYYTTQQMDAGEVFFVIGTSVVGPMGSDLVPVKGRDAAENLMRDYNGEQIVTLDRITDELIERARRGRLK